MATASTPDFQVVKADLGRAIRRLRLEGQPMETARLLLSYDGPGQPLVGIRYDGERAVYYDERRGLAVGVVFDSDGLDPRAGRPVASLPDGGSVAGWVERTRYYWGWRHPRFR